MTLKGLGFDGKHTKYYNELKQANKEKIQEELF